MPRGIGRIGVVLLVVAALLLGWRYAITPRDPVVGRVFPVQLASAVLGRKLRPVVQPRLINLFASWCVPCAAEAPVLAAMARRGVRIDGIAVRDRPAAVSAFLTRWGNPFVEVRSDPRGLLQAALAVSGIPETYVVDGAGVIRYRHRGNLQVGDLPELERQLAAAR